ncbi:MAG: aspartate ammonia-lyase [Erysipelotrichaceae bacterium]|nr:MAG: aspartate ammonia-lyase [Erysipelotrichaceae bacterium]
MRTEKDFLGEVNLEDTHYGIHTLRAFRNQRKTSLELIYAIVQIKKAAAQANFKVKLLPSEKYNAIIFACDQILAGFFDDQFITHPFQGGAGTSTNMNVNEVIANIALEHLGYPKGTYDVLSPIEDVNMSQSTNDVYPSAMRISAIYALRKLADEFALLQKAFIEKEQATGHMLHLGRTQYMDALPLSWGQTFSAYASLINRDRWRLYKVEERLRTINLGGTAIGTGINADQKYIFAATDLIQEITGLGLARAENLIDATQNLDVFVEVSGLIKTAAVSLMKIANDFRLLGSGPHGGLGELTLPAHQTGSSIMFGKINPVILEAIIQIALKVQGNDSIITSAVSLGVLELNAFGPLIIDALLESMNLLNSAAVKMRTHVLEGLSINEAICMEHLEKSNALITILNPILGYETISHIIAKANLEHKTIRTILLEEELFSQEELDRYLDPQSMISPGVVKR